MRNAAAPKEEGKTDGKKTKRKAGNRGLGGFFIKEKINTWVSPNSA
jgi:hypothetical protein